MEDVLIRDREAILEVEESGDEDGAVSLAAKARSPPGGIAGPPFAQQRSSS